jgi:hypothetical protein
MARDLVALSEQALASLDGVEAVPGYVFLPPRLRGKRVRIVQDVAVKTSLPNIRDNIVRIVDEVDPIGLMIAIANGQPVASFYVEEGEDGEPVVAVRYETVDLKDRLNIIRALADRVHPRMSISQSVPPEKPAGDKPRAAALLANAERDADATG